MIFDVGGMSCAACSAKVEKVVSEIKGVQNCQVSLLTGKMNVSGKFSKDDVITAVQKAGYNAKESNSQTQENLADKENDLFYSLLKKLITSLVILLLLLFTPAFLHHFNLTPTISLQNGTISVLKLIQAVLALAVIIINRSFFTSGFKGFIHKTPNMNTLVALGSTASFLYGSFDGAAMILTFITIGKTLEAKAKGKTTNAIKNLMKLTPEKAILQLSDGTQKEIPAAQLKIGDIFIVKPGQNIPVDGIVVKGHSTVNEASITGESLPVEKKAAEESASALDASESTYSKSQSAESTYSESPSAESTTPSPDSCSTVTAGTTNINGILYCKATRVGSDTTISKIIQMVSECSASKAPVQKFADKVSAVFVPVVMILAALTFICWLFIEQDIKFALLRGISILVISCPCALGLATPVAIMVGNGVGAKNNILFKNATALEMAGKARIVVLDKTGTITKGVLTVTDVQGPDVKKALNIAFALEKNSTHPVAKAICRYVLEQGDFSDGGDFSDFTDFSEQPGAGVSAILATTGQKYFCGKIPNSNLICVTCDGKILAKITVEDEIKEDSKTAIGELKNMGIEVFMLTGDNAENAKKIASQCEIAETNIIAGVMPDQKANKIMQLQKKGMVIMTGDGINDAPSLTAANVGIAIGAGSDIAIESASVVLSKNTITDVEKTIKLSRAVSKNIKENLFWALFYNAIAIPVAAGVFYKAGLTLTPALSSACMSLSSFCVVSNALRLNRLNKTLFRK